MTREYWEEQFKKVLSVIVNYDNNELALTKKDLSLAYKEKQFWLDKCEHWEKEIGFQEDYRQDEYGSGHTSYYHITRCLVCKNEKSYQIQDYQLKGLKRLK